uniref:PHD finger protein 5A n=2 Tax=Passeriformes TaxID=9126 RepID=A0A8D2PE69_ZOSLA
LFDIQACSYFDFSPALNNFFLFFPPAIGRLCEKCDGKCVICDSYVRPCTLVRICDECNYGSYQGRCVICGGPGVSDAYYCKECTIQEKDRDGCPKIVNLGSSKTDLFYERKKYGFKKR